MEPFLETWEYESFYYRRAFRTCWLERMCRHSVLPSIAHYLFVEDDCSEKRHNGVHRIGGRANGVANRPAL